MANFKQPIFAAGFSSPFVKISPDPIVAQRDPLPSDEAFDGQIWVNTETNTGYIAAGTDSLGTVWVVSGSSTFTGFDLTINPGPTVINGDFTVTSTTGTAGTITMETNGAVTETISITNIQGTATNAIEIIANQGGLDLISSDAAADSVLISASNPAGGVTIDAGTGGITLNTSGAITMAPGTATSFIVAAGDLDLEATTGSVVIEGGEAVVDAIQLTTTNAAGGIDINAGTGGITIDTTGTLSIDSAGTTNLTATGAFDVTVNTTAGSLNLSAGEAVADAINIDSTGGVDLDAALQVNIASSQNSATAISLNASAGAIELQAQGAAGEDIVLNNVAGSINITPGEAQANALRINCATGGIDADAALQINLASSQNSATAISINASAGGMELIAAGAAGEDIVLTNTAGSIHLTAGEAAADAVNIDSTGGFDLDAALQINVDSSQAAANAVRVIASNAAGGIDVDAGTAGITVDTTGALSLDSAAASNYTVTGAFDLTLNSTAGSVNISGGEAVADAINIDSTGGVDLDAALQVNIASSQNAADAIVLSASAGGIDIQAQGAAGEDILITNVAGSVDISAGEAVADALVLVAPAGGLDVNVALQMNLDSSQAAVDAVRVFASNAAGGIDVDAGTAGITIDTTGALSLDAAAASNLTVTGAFDLTANSTAGRAILQSGKAAADAVKLNSTDAAGGITMNSGTGGLIGTTTGPITMNCQNNALLKTTGAFDIQIQSTLGGVLVIGSEAADDAVLISAVDPAGGITLDAGPTPGVTLTNGTQSAQILVGTGSPNTVVTAAQGSIFLRTDGAAGSTLYYNTNGITAWTAL